MPKNQCYTYFRIVGQFDPAAVTALLGIRPAAAHRAGDIRRDGKPYPSAGWESARCDDYDSDISRQMEQAIAPFQNKRAALAALRETGDVSFYLEVVPTLYAGEVAPCLAPSLAVMDFCHETRTELDIDLYLPEK